MDGRFTCSKRPGNARCTHIQSIPPPPCVDFALCAKTYVPMKMIDGCICSAMRKSILTNFSASPCHLLVSDEAEMAKNVALASCASACEKTPSIYRFS